VVKRLFEFDHDLKQSVIGQGRVFGGAAGQSVDVVAEVRVARRSRAKPMRLMIDEGLSPFLGISADGYGTGSRAVRMPT